MLPTILLMVAALGSLASCTDYANKCGVNLPLEESLKRRSGELPYPSETEVNQITIYVHKILLL
jgi:hypothetical protein